MPVTRPAPGASSSYMSQAASGESSRKGEPGIEQRVDPLAHRQLALFAMPLEVRARRRPGGTRSSRSRSCFDEAGHPLAVRGELRGVGPDVASRTSIGACRFGLTGSTGAGL